MTDKDDTSHSSDQPEPGPVAIALTYDGQNAPFVSATGEAELAEEILRIAKDNEIPIYENPELAGMLSRLELGDEIPELLYRCIAEIIAFVYMLKRKTPEGFQAHDTQEQDKKTGRDNQEGNPPALPDFSNDEPEQPRDN